ncbi:MAG TPA: tRNA (adenosine(37)-N6)-threonylcarbamoyltransferase complex ATPase subunit type 1 TsaE [Gammaproteobacteria bacterium]|nr:tRNA (adenosine(37)-N6)-threonylcarbamoyltransferase complex ATPase subunit type 1 TsaE [Gammaproteobacteria bacterium]
MLSRRFESEAELVRAAGEIAARWRGLGLKPLRAALRGDLGSGKTTWVRAMLRGLGYGGRVPSPTYTLVEHYPLEELVVAHFDLYRLAGSVELENLGFRDWLAEPAAWLLIEWPERGGDLAARCDLELEFQIVGTDSRRVAAAAHSSGGETALRAFSELAFNNTL